MHPILPISAIAQLIQLSIAPVFLLAGIGAILNVLAQRLARVVDRARTLEGDFASYDEERRERASNELGLLDQRMRVVNHAISACTASALFVCLVVALLFIADFAGFEFGTPVALLFILSMVFLIIGLVLFLWEVRLAMQAIRIRREHLPTRRP